MSRTTLKSGVTVGARGHHPAGPRGLLRPRCLGRGQRQPHGVVGHRHQAVQPLAGAGPDQRSRSTTKPPPWSRKRSRQDGKLTVAVSPFAAPLAVYATDNKTPVGNEVDLAVALAQSLGLEADIVPTAWADWPLGVESGKYEAVLSNVTVTEERKLKFDFASYRDDKLGFYAKADSAIGKVETAEDVAGKRVIVGSGTNQESILLRWDEENKAKGLKPVEFQYYDDDSASQLAIQSGRADLTFGPNATAAFKAASDAKTKLVGLVDGGWPLKANIAATTKKGNGFAVAAAAGLNHLIEDGSYAKILDRWGLSSEAVTKSEVNPAGLPKK